MAITKTRRRVLKNHLKRLNQELINYARDGNWEMVEETLNTGADIDTACQMAGKTALHYAAEAGDFEAVAMLCDNGADPRLTDNEHRTPRQIAIKLEFEDIARFLEDDE
ncbi:MAG: ankyrin repeat domain-containing protein [Candidatus Buchananbacteria bacterium]